MTDRPPCLTRRRNPTGSVDGCRRVVRCAEDGAPDRRHLFRRRGERTVGGRAADPRAGPAQDPAGRRTADLLPCRHRGRVLGLDGGRRGEASGRGRHHRLHARRPARPVECAWHARRACGARPFNPLLDQLPAIITTSWRESGPSWLGQFIMLARAESGSRRAGAESVLAKLSELLFIETLRRYIESLPAGQTGWLAGLRDPGVGKALSVLHARPARDWTIEELAREVAMSRSVLAERFNHLVGLPPMQYLAAWRMQLAAGLLNGGGNVASVAAEVGYASEAGFSRAFKKIVGVPPSAWRG